MSMILVRQREELCELRSRKGRVGQKGEGERMKGELEVKKESLYLRVWTVSGRMKGKREEDKGWNRAQAMSGVSTRLTVLLGDSSLRCDFFMSSVHTSCATWLSFGRPKSARWRFLQAAGQ
ncbi:unnamed protein product [Protopolystoma xenopodis]|uniref:Uncharacterized protein n=1 Tax=Protopolystoma xenopodis TaxID=117903 RepID=A0A448XEF2_9PLAT|nr:unnamed protein product [Protopolystoma xenopodis]